MNKNYLKIISTLILLIGFFIEGKSATEPTVPASNITFSGMSMASMMINWTNGNGTNRIVFVKSGSMGTIVNPTDGSTYSASADWSSKGTQLSSSGYFCAYKGTASSILLTNLSTNTMYYVAIYEYNTGTSPSPNYLTTSYATSNQSTMPNAPSRPTSLTLTNSTYNSLDITFTAPGTAPTGYIVLKNAGSAVIGAPTNGTVYTAGQSNIGGGTNEVVYVGTSVLTNSTQTNLIDTTMYYYAVYSYNGTGNVSTYSTTSRTANKSTSPIVITSANSATLTTTNSFSANWTAQSGASSYQLDVYQKDASLSTIASESFENSMTLFSATTGTGTYGTGNSTSGDRPATSPVTTLGTYSFGKTNGSVTITSSDINTYSYSNIEMNLKLASFSIANTSNGAENTDIVTVEISPDGGTNYYSTLRVLGNNNAYWAFSATGNASTTYDGNATSVDFSPTGGGSRTTDGYSNISISGLPSKSNLRVRITLLNNSNVERWVIDEFKISGYAKTFVTGFENLSVTGSSKLVNGLNANTNYKYCLRSVGSNSTSANSNEISITTYKSPDTLTSHIDCSVNGGDILIKWNKGSGDGRLVKVNTTNSFTNPTDRVDYSASVNPIWQGAGEQIVYDGSDTSITVSNLLVENTYYITAFEYHTYSEAKASVKIYGKGIISDNNGDGGVLPITLLSFTANKIDKGVEILWTTSSEINNDFFTVEKSYDGRNFSEISVVKGQGNTSLVTNYKIFDNTQLSSITYYRLKQTNYDGSSSYSKLIMLTNSKTSDFKLVNAWVSSSNTLNFQLQSDMETTSKVEILNSAGQLLKVSEIEIKEGNNIYASEINSLSHGIYFIRVQMNGIIALRKILF